jgi:hypothetical protein
MSKLLIAGAIALVLLAVNINAQCYIRSGLTDVQKADLLRKHNELRNLVASGQQANQPSASNMQEMVWDDSLNTLAQNYANTCPGNHNPNRNGAGENLYWGMSSRDSTNVDLKVGIQSWYDEVSMFSSSSISPYKFSSGVGHYTQVVWASSNKLGINFIINIIIQNKNKYLRDFLSKLGL